MSRLRPMEYIFSITNSGEYKRIVILGIPIKINITAKNKKMCNDLPVQKNKIVFMNYLGKSFGCNPKYVALEILKRKLPLDLVWILEDTDKNEDIPNGIRVVKYKSQECLKEVATAKFWVTNYHFVKLFSMGVRKKPEQCYIQMWHGSLGIKKIEKDVKLLTRDKDWTKFAQYNSENVDYWISNSKFETGIYKNAFWNVRDIKEFGHPRNDIFYKTFEEKTSIKEKVLKKLNIPADRKVLLYVPSFRDNNCVKCFDLDYKKVLEACKNRFGGNWVCITRFHPRLGKLNKKLFLKGHNKGLTTVYNGSDYPDIQELLSSADIVISDYSSCIFDFILTKRPAFIFATDIKKFNNDRGFYYPLETTPFPIAQNNTRLVDNILGFDTAQYNLKVEEFLQEKGCMENGTAANKVADLIESVMKEDRV